MDIQTPDAVQKALSKLDDSDREAVEAFIEDLKSQIYKGTEDDEDDYDDVDLPDAADKSAAAAADEEDAAIDYPPVYTSGEDYDKAGDEKQAASDCKDSGDWEGALRHYTEAVLAAPPSALLYANRAHALAQLGKLKEAERDCNLALQENPDSAKALRTRGKVRKELGDYEGALHDLSTSQTIDFDEGTVEDLKFLTEKHLEKEKLEAEERIKKEEALRKRAEEIKKAKEEAKRSSSTSSTARGDAGMPGGGGFGGGGGGGMPGGFPGMPGGGMGGIPGMEGLMGDLMQDPELMAALQKPKVVAALSQMMGGGGADPAKMMELMSDPEVGPVLQKFMAKIQGGAGAGGMPGGFGGSPGGFGGGPGGFGGGVDDDTGDIPDLDDLPDLE